MISECRIKPDPAIDLNIKFQSQVADLKAKVKEKSEALASLQSQHTTDSKEIAELKYKLGAELGSNQDALDGLSEVRLKFEEIQAKYVQSEKANTKLTKKLVLERLISRRS